MVAAGSLRSPVASCFMALQLNSGRYAVHRDLVSMSTIRVSSPPEVQPLTVAGAWVLESGYRRRAHQMLARLEPLAAEVSRVVDAAVAAKKAGVPGGAILPQSVAETSEELRTLSDVTVIFSAMAVEAFLNYYGVVRLKGEWYHEHLERKPVSTKLRELLRICCGQPTSKDAEIMTVVRRLFDRRNMLVHPKTYDAKTGSKAPFVIPAPTMARESVADMTQFFDLMADYDPATRTCEWL